MPLASKRLKFLHESTLYLISNLMRRAMGFLLIPLYTKLLTPAEFGTIELIELTITVVGISIGMQALGNALVRVYNDVTDPSEPPRVVSTAILGSAALGALIALPGILLAPWISNVVLGNYAGTNLVRGSFLAMIPGNLIELALTYLRLQGRVYGFVIYSVLQTVAQLSLNIYFIAFAHYGVAGYVVSKLLTTGVGAIALLGMVLRETGVHWDWGIKRRMTSFGSPLIVSGLALLTIHYSDRYFIQSLTTLGDVGIYALAYKFAFLVTYLIGEPFGSAWNVRMYSYPMDGDWSRKIRGVADMLAFALVGGGVAISAASQPALEVMASSSFRGAVALLPLLVLAYVMREFGDFWNHLLYINKRSDAIGRMSIVCAVSNIILNFVLIREFGVMGAAISTLASWCLHLALSWWMAEKEYRIHYPMGRFLALLAFGCAAITVAAMSSGHDWGLVIRSGTVAAFLLGAWMSGFLKDTDAPMAAAKILARFRASVSRPSIAGE